MILVMAPMVLSGCNTHGHWPIAINAGEAFILHLAVPIGSFIEKKMVL